MLRIRLVCTLVFGLMGAMASAADPKEYNLWHDIAPGEKGNVPPEIFGDPKAPPGSPARSRVTNVSKPTMTVYRPANTANTGAAIIVAPGGGYTFLSWENEGTKVAEWLQSLGVTAVLLKYRVPRRPDQPDVPPIGALQDAQRTISLVRVNAKTWNLDPQKIGFLGFSAGGHLGAWAATNFDKRSYPEADAADKVSCRPDFAVLIYPGGLVPKDKKDVMINMSAVVPLQPEIRVTKDTPPCFFALAYNDDGPFLGSMRMVQALRQAGVKTEMHLFAEGGHGFGMKDGTLPANSWPKRCEEWLKAEGFLSAKK